MKPIKRPWRVVVSQRFYFMTREQAYSFGEQYMNSHPERDSLDVRLHTLKPKAKRKK